MGLLTTCGVRPTLPSRIAAWASLGGMLLAVLVAASPAWAGEAAPEDAVKAAYIVKFTHFMDWPAAAFATPSSPFFVCVLGDDALGAVLGQASDGHAVGGHPMKLRRLDGLNGAEKCHILYLGPTRTADAAAVLAKVRGSPVLTVTERAFGFSGVAVQFFVKANHLEFAIDAKAAAANRVQISAKLLSLAEAFEEGS